jgi:hypothetical protein
MLSLLYADPVKNHTPLPTGREVRADWVQTPFRGPTDYDNLTIESQEKRDEYRSLMLKEPAVSTAYWSLIASVMSLPPTIQAENPDDPRSVAVANACKDWIGEVEGGWPRLIRDIGAGALLDGFSVNELIFDFPERGRWAAPECRSLVLKDISPLDTRWIRFDVDQFKRVTGVRATRANAGEVFGTDRFAIFSHQSLFSNPFGISKFRAAYRAAKIIESAVKLRTILLQNFTGPFIAFKSGAATSREVALSAVAEARAMGFMVCDQNDELQVQNLAASSDSEFQSAIDDLRKEIYTAIRWGYLPFTEASAGAKVGNTSVQRSMTQLGEWMLATDVAAVIQSQIIKPLVRRNVADTTIGFPRLTLGGREIGDIREQAGIYEVAKRLGYKLSKKQVSRALELEEPLDKDDELAEDTQQNGLPGLPPGGGQPRQPPTPGDPERLPLSMPFADPDAVQAASESSPDELDHAAMLAIVDLQAKAAAAGTPGRFGRAIETLKGMIGNHVQLLAAIGGETTQFGWAPARSASGKLKAVGNAEHAGRTLYGSRAEAALKSHERTAAVREEGENHQKRVQEAKQGAKAIANRAVMGQVTTDDYRQLVEHIPHLNVQELRNLRVQIGARFNNAKRREGMVSALIEHATRAASEGDQPANVQPKGYNPAKRAAAAEAIAAALEKKAVRNREDRAALGEHLGHLSRSQLQDLLDEHTAIGGRGVGLSREQLHGHVLDAIEGGVFSKPDNDRAPHTMTRAEFAGGNSTKAIEHREHVKDALAGGTAVPPAVLKDYPDLEAHAQDTGMAPAAPDAGKPDGKADPTLPSIDTPQGLRDEILSRFHHLATERHHIKGQVPIHEIRDSMIEDYGDTARVRAVFDETIQDMRIDKHLSLYGKTGSTPEEWANHVHTPGGSFYYAGAASGTPQSPREHTPAAWRGTTRHTPESIQPHVQAEIENVFKNRTADESDIVPIHEIRRRIAEKHGPQAASHAVFDKAILNLRQFRETDGSLTHGLTSISDRSRATTQELTDSVSSVGETFFYADRPKTVPPKQAGRGEKQGATRPDGTPEAPTQTDVHTVDPKALKVDAKRFQYKVTGIKADGVTDELRGVQQWNPALGGTLLVWRDPKDGQDYVVNGHHRHELASRLGADKINVRYLEANDAKQARSLGALANIAEGRGSAVDAAKYMRDTGDTPGDLQRYGVSLSGRVAADAIQLRDLSDKAFQAVTNGDLPESTAVAVAKHLKEHAGQDMLFKKLRQREDDGKDWSVREVETAAKKLARAGKVTESTTNLFGTFEDEKSTFDQEVELETHIGRELASRTNNYAAVSQQKRADAVAGAGNVLNVEENQKRRKAAEAAVETFDRESGLKSAISDTILKHAAELASAKTKKDKEDVKRHALAEVEQHLASDGKPTNTTAAAATAAAEPVAAQPGGAGTTGQTDANPTPPTAATNELAPPVAEPAAPDPQKSYRATGVFGKPGSPSAKAPESATHADIGSLWASTGTDAGWAAFAERAGQANVSRDALVEIAKWAGQGDAVKRLPKGKILELLKANRPNDGAVQPEQPTALLTVAASESANQPAMEAVASSAEPPAGSELTGDPTTSQSAANSAPKDGDRDESGLVFRDGRWHRDNELQSTAPAAVSVNIDEINNINFDKSQKKLDWPWLNTLKENQSNGKFTAAQAQAISQTLHENRDKLLENFRVVAKSSGLRKPEKIEEMSEDLLAHAFDTLNYGGGLTSYSLPIGSSREAYRNARLDAMYRAAQKVTDEQIAKHNEKIRQQKDSRQKAIDNPETIEEFTTHMRAKGIQVSDLPDELQARYDELRASARRERDSAERAKRAIVAPVSSGPRPNSIHQGKHTKTGRDIHIVNIVDRVGSDEFRSLNEAAKKLGGSGYQRNSHYSRGAMPDGFNFDTPEQAQKFSEFLNGQAASRLDDWDERAAETKQATAERFRTMAANMKANADEVRSADRQVNTARRARMAESVIGDANKREALAETMEQIADKIEAGEANHLSGIRSRTQLQSLDTVLSRAKFTAIQKSGKRYEQEKDRAAELSDVRHAEYPLPYYDKGELLRYAAKMKETPGAKRAGEVMRKYAEKMTEAEHIKDPAILNHLTEIARNPRSYGLTESEGKVARYKMEDHMRLQAADIKSTAELRAALREYVTLKSKPKQEPKSAKLERDLAGRKIPGFFPTPRWSIDEMLNRAEIEPGMKVLEPSAGKGDILDAIAERHPEAERHGIESYSDLASLVREKGHSVEHGDFLTHYPTGNDRPDRIVMNPPFESGQDMTHVQHAYNILKPGGKMVAIMSEGPFFRADSKANEFREWLDSVSGEVEAMPEGSFAGNDAFRKTGVRTRMVTISKSNIGD